MSAVGDSGTSKSRTSHIKQATLIPALLLGSGEGASEEPPNSPLLFFSHSPQARAPALSPLFPFLHVCRRCPEKTQAESAGLPHNVQSRPHVSFLFFSFTERVSKLRAQWCYSGADRSPFLILMENNKQHTHKHTEKCNMMSKQTTRMRRPSKRAGIKIQCR